MASTTVDPPKISPNDRLSFSMFLAVALHATIIFGIGFSYLEQKAASSTLEITLAQHRSETAPQEADFLAQANQEGSGTLEEKAMISTPEVSDFQDNVIREIDPQQSQANIPEQPKPETTVITTTTERSLKASIKHRDQVDPQPSQTESQLTMLQRSLEIASLEAQLRQKKQRLAKRPRKRQLTAASTKEARDALYLDQWRTEIERIGNLNYPEKARAQGLYGSLRLLVAINSNGSLHDIEVLKSSGHKILDDAAIKIVRMAAPYQAFPPEIKVDTDILEIIRTWRFERGDHLSSD